MMLYLSSAPLNSSLKQVLYLFYISSHIYGTSSKPEQTNQLSPKPPEMCFKALSKLWNDTKFIELRHIILQFM